MAALYSILRILSIVAVLAVVSGGRSFSDEDEERSFSFFKEKDGPRTVYTDDQDSSESSYSSPSSYPSSYKDEAPSKPYSTPSPMSHSSYKAPSSSYQAPKPSYSSYQAPSTYQAPSKPSYSSYEAPKPSYSSYQAPSTYQAPSKPSYSSYEAPKPTYEAAPSYEEPKNDDYDYQQPITIHDLRKLPRRILNKYYKMIYSPIYQINRDARTARDNNLVIRNDYLSKQKSGGYGKDEGENEDNYKNCISDIRATGRNALVNNLLFSCNGLLYNLFGSNGMNQEHPAPSKQ